MAKQEINMPRFGATMVKGKIIEWKVVVGEHVKEEQLLLEVQTEKSAAEVESLYTGTITEIIAKDGEEYNVGEVLGYLEED